MIKYLKKLRKEIEKWLEIPKVLRENKQLIEDKEELNRQITFVTNNEHKRTEEVIKLKKDIETLKANNGK